MVPNERFVELLGDIEPSPTTKSRASGAHQSLRKFLRDHEGFSSLWVDDFLAGSYARHTAIRPRTGTDGQERPDVDIIVVTNYSLGAPPDDVLQHLAAVLRRAYVVERVNKSGLQDFVWAAAS